MKGKQVIKLSKSAYEIDGQPMFKVLDKVQRLEREGRDILHFELGEPDFDTPKNIIDACIGALNEGEAELDYTAEKIGRFFDVKF